MKNSLPWEEILRTLHADTILNDDGWLGSDISRVYGSDLMSDILSYSKPNSLAFRAACVRSRTPNLPRICVT